MKKQLLALSLIATSGLIAQDNNSNMSSQQSSCCNTCNFTPCCCVPKPKKCIDCECYTPMFYDLQCDCGFFFSVDFLYWYARETNLTYALQVNGVSKDAEDNLSPVVLSPNNYKNLTTKWDPGFRVGIGWNNGCDGWDYYLHWTYMHNSKSNSTSVASDYALNGDQIFLPDENQQALVNQWVNPGLFAVNGVNNVAPITFDTIRASWKLQNWNTVDLELGRKYWLSPCFNLRPFIGVRGAWDRVNFRTTSTRTSPIDNTTTEPLVFRDRFRSRLWGVGILGGIQPTFYYCSNFAVFGSMNAALIWGEFEVRKRENYQDPDGISGTPGIAIIDWNPPASKSTFFQMTPIIDLAIGLRWEENWCCDQYRSNLDIGWEHHVWFDQNHRAKLVDFFAGPAASTLMRQGTGFRTFDEATGNLALGGLVVRLRVDF